MAFTLTIEGQVTKTGGAPAVGVTVTMHQEVGASPDTDVTDASGNYSVSHTEATETGEAHWVTVGPVSPHLGSDTSPEHDHEHASFTENLFMVVSNNNPTTTAISARSYEEDSGIYTADFTMSDADAGDVLTPAKVSGDAWGTVSKISNSIGRWTFNTSGVAPGVYNGFQYRCTDDWGGTSTTRSVQVTITSGNTAPTLTSPGNKSYANKSGNQTFQLVASDPESDPLTYSKQSGPSWVTCSVSGLVTVATNSATRGVHSVTFRVSDGSLTNDKTITITITNNAPVIAAMGNLSYTVDSGSPTESSSATDVDGDSKTWDKTVGPSWGSINASTGLRTFTLAGIVSGVYNFTWRANDGNGGTDTESHTVTLVEPEDAPFFQMMG
jgi:hypothetical protein